MSKKDLQTFRMSTHNPSVPDREVYEVLQNERKSIIMNLHLDEYIKRRQEENLELEMKNKFEPIQELNPRKYLIDGIGMADILKKQNDELWSDLQTYKLSQNFNNNGSVRL